MTNTNKLIRNSTAEFLMFTGEDSIEVRVEDETVWLTQKMLAQLFDVNVRTISEHLQTIFASEELLENSVVRNFRNTAADGKQYNFQLNDDEFQNWTSQIVMSNADKMNAGKKMKNLPMTSGTCNQKRDFINTFAATCYQNSGFLCMFKVSFTRISGFLCMTKDNGKLIVESGK